LCIVIAAEDSKSKNRRATMEHDSERDAEMPPVGMASAISKKRKRTSNISNEMVNGTEMALATKKSTPDVAAGPDASTKTHQTMNNFAPPPCYRPPPPMFAPPLRGCEVRVLLPVSCIPNLDLEALWAEEGGIGGGEIAVKTVSTEVFALGVWPGDRLLSVNGNSVPGLGGPSEAKKMLLAECERKFCPAADVRFRRVMPPPRPPVPPPFFGHNFRGLPYPPRPYRIPHPPLPPPPRHGHLKGGRLGPLAPFQEGPKGRERRGEAEDKIGDESKGQPNCHPPRWHPVLGPRGDAKRSPWCSSTSNKQESESNSYPGKSAAVPDVAEYEQLRSDLDEAQKDLAAKEELLETAKADLKILQDRTSEFNKIIVQLIEFQKEKGHCRVPNVYKGGNKGSLGWWVKRQRQIRSLQERNDPDEKISRELAAVKKSMQAGDVLDCEQIDILNAFGLSLSMNYWDNWDRCYAELVEYKNANGHCIVPFSKNGGLGSWVHCQRSAYRLKRQRDKWIKEHGTVEGFNERRKKYNRAISDERIARLNEIGFKWTFLSPITWDEMFIELEKYREENGHW